MYAEWVEQMNHASSAAERRNVINRMCEIFAFGTQKAYSTLKDAGWASGRKKRADAGTSAIPDANLDALAAVLQNSLRKNGKKTMSVETARSVLVQNGFSIPLSDSRLRELLSQRVLSTEQNNRASPFQRMRTEYPNQVHFADPSVALLYYAPTGKQKIVGDDEEYKNKSYLEDRMKCWRYVLTDHYSSAICVRYYAAKGETAVNMYDFLLYAWAKKQDPLYGFHGLPELLIWDCGSANISKPVTKALEALRVKAVPHLPGNPRAKGQVEKANDIVERQFESLLKLEPVHSIDALNDAAEHWCAAFNANLLEGKDTRLSRAGRVIGSRLELWNRIEQKQLRELPDEATCRQIFTTGVSVRKVGGDLAVTLSHPKTGMVHRYSLSALPDILIGMNVNVQPILVDTEPLIQVSYEVNGEIQSYEVKPIVYDDVGFDLAAPVYGSGYKSEPGTIREKNVGRLAELALGGNTNKDTVPFTSITEGEGLKTHSLIRTENPFARQIIGTQIEVSAGTVEVHEILITAVETAKRFKARAGYIPEGFISRMKAEYPEGVPSALVDDLVHEYENGTTAEIKLA